MTSYNNKMASWHIPALDSRDFCLRYTLGGGQSFRWKSHKEGEWFGVLDDCVLKFCTDGKDRVQCQVLASVDSSAETMKGRVDRFLRTEVDLQALYSCWSGRDGYFSSLAPQVPGIRMLRQEPVETVFAFICSANNNIPRITGMMDKLCKHYGERIGDTLGTSWYSFPSPSQLADAGIEEELRDLGFGYRAKFIQQTAKILSEKGDDWLNSLRDSCEYIEAREALMLLPGVGPKVADCICLMSLDKLEAVPVDTHVWQVAQQHYGFNSSSSSSKTRSLTGKLYMEIGG